MKKFSAFLLMLAFISMICSACTVQSKTSNMVKSKRRFAEYIESQSQNKTGTIDLSEGPKQNYEGYLGPQKLNFDIKIVDPY